eukprot:s625_g37.t1
MESLCLKFVSWCIKRQGSNVLKPQLQRTRSGINVPPKNQKAPRRRQSRAKRKKRRERQRTNRAAAAKRKDFECEKMAKEHFLRETAEGFTERQMPLEPTKPEKNERKSKAHQATKELRKN